MRVLRGYDDQSHPGIGKIQGPKRQSEREILIRIRSADFSKRLPLMTGPSHFAARCQHRHDAAILQNSLSIVHNFKLWKTFFRTSIASACAAAINAAICWTPGGRKIE